LASTESGEGEAAPRKEKKRNELVLSLLSPLLLQYTFIPYSFIHSSGSEILIGTTFNPVVVPVGHAVVSSVSQMKLLVQMLMEIL
jgi:hypothetical protein